MASFRSQCYLLGIIQRGERFMIVTTTPTVEGRPVAEYYGVVTGEVIIGANIFRDLFANISDIVGGRSGSYERALGKAREEAFSEMEEKAAKRGGNAVVGVDIDYEVIGQNGSMLMVSVSGTAVRI
tara:strand:- start:165 stop:542 length:378 start_codon:yes stop_codon:yes gene_type:complete